MYNSKLAVTKNFQKKGVIKPMKHLSILLVIGLLFGVTVVYATEGAFNITVSCNRSVSVKVTTGTTITDNDASLSCAFGTLDTGVTCMAGLVSGTTSFKVWNNSPSNSGAVQNYTLSITTGSGTDEEYLRGDGTFTAAADTYSVAAVFTAADVTPTGTSDFADDDALEYRTGTAVGTDDWTATTAFSPATSNRRYSAETKHPRDTGANTLLLWLAIKTPTSVTSTGAAAKTWGLTLSAE